MISGAVVHVSGASLISLGESEQLLLRIRAVADRAPMAEKISRRIAV